MRHQNRSCDQCRRSKRACDSASNTERGSASGTGSSFVQSSAVNGSSDPGYPSRTCSYCLKTGKTCTYAWAREQAQSGKHQDDPIRDSPLPGLRGHPKRRRKSSAPQRPKNMAYDTGKVSKTKSEPAQFATLNRNRPSANVDQTWLDNLVAPTVTEDALADMEDDGLPIEEDALQLDFGNIFSDMNTASIGVSEPVQTGTPNFDFSVNIDHSWLGTWVAPTIAEAPPADVDEGWFAVDEDKSQIDIGSMASDMNTASIGVSEPVQTTTMDGNSFPANVDFSWLDSLVAPAVAEHPPAVVEEDYSSIDENTLQLDKQETFAAKTIATPGYPGPPDNDLNLVFGLTAESASAPGAKLVTPAGSSEHHFLEDGINRDGSPQKRRRGSFRRTSATRLVSLPMAQSMTAQTNHNMIFENLFRIYHDVLEHNLSCWLTEQTCPYTGRRAVGVNDWHLKSPAVEQGATWSNRIYLRAVRLDRYASSTKLIQFTRKEDRAASMALHLSIMAFASQWAQGSRREREEYQSPDQNTEMDMLAEEFDRHVQISLWEQAKRALQDTAELESYRIVCAELIFGLCQKPWDPDNLDSPMHEPDVLDSSSAKSLLTRLQRAISKDGMPVHMERAARKMHALKYRWDSREAGMFDRQQDPKQRPRKGTPTNTGQDSEHERTVGLLFWLAVMFDTVSSSMNERPVVVADEDSQHRDASIVSSDRETTTSSCGSGQHSREGPGRWSTKLFIQDDPEGPTHVTPRWPCSYEAAAEAVTRSAPVKVLLFRHVSWLQNVLRKKQEGRVIENIISHTTSLYRYWNLTYGAFFRDLVWHFPSVPPRIQGWFFCISAHWHLAVLLFADLLEFIDKNGLGVSGLSQSRLQSNMTKRIRSASANEIADLAGVAVPPDADAGDETTSHASRPPLGPDFHFAVNKCTILTEPWTIIVIRAFTKAGAMHVAQAEDLWQTELADLGHEGESCEESLKRCKECIKALWFLGKKSDMARSTADILSGAFTQLSRNIGLL